MNRQQILHELDRETEYYSDHTRRQYFSHAQDYLDYVGDGDWKDRDILYNYLQKLKKKGHAQSHINYLIRGPIGALFRAYGLPIPVKLPRIKMSGSIVDITERIQYSLEDIVRIIKAARDSGDKKYQAIMVISTIYFPRASEIRAIRKEDVHPKRKTIVIYTLKEGFKREHFIPPEIAPYIFNYDFPHMSEAKLYEVFHDVIKLAGIERVPRKVYHAIRHGVITEMRYGAKLPRDTIATFAAWREGGMVGQYARPFPYIPENDEEIFAKHPFLKYWK